MFIPTLLYPFKNLLVAKPPYIAHHLGCSSTTVAGYPIYIIEELGIKIVPTLLKSDTHGFFLNCFKSTFSLLYTTMLDLDYLTSVNVYVPIRANILFANKTPSSNTFFMEHVLASQLMNFVVCEHGLLRVNERSSDTCGLSAHSANVVA